MQLNKKKLVIVEIHGFINTCPHNKCMFKNAVAHKANVKGMGPREAKKLFKITKRNLDRVDFRQGPRGGTCFYGGLANPFKKTVGGVEVAISRKGAQSGGKAYSQEIRVGNQCFCREMPPGVLAKANRMSKQTIIAAAIGSSVGGLAFLADTLLNSPLPGEGAIVAGAIGGIGIGVIGNIVETAGSIIQNIGKGFRSRMLKFMRTPGNEDALNALVEAARPPKF
jgi:hypothetical protein